MARVLQFSWFKWAKRLPVRGASARGAPVPAYRPPVWAVDSITGELLPVMRLLKLTEMRDVSLEEIQRAAAGRASNARIRRHSHTATSLHALYMRRRYAEQHNR